MDGLIWGISSALHEATEIDPHAARYTNTDLAEYLIPVNADVDKVEVILIPEGDRQVNDRARQCWYQRCGRQRGLSRHRRARARPADPAQEVARRTDHRAVTQGFQFGRFSLRPPRG